MNNNANKIKIGLADDHALIREALAALIRSFEICEMVFTVSNGFEVMGKLGQGFIPDVLILNVDMPEMDGFATLAWLQLNHPNVKVLMQVVSETEQEKIRLLKAGVNGFLTKDTPAAELHFAITTIMKEIFYFDHTLVAKKEYALYNNIEIATEKKFFLNKPERVFISLSCTDLTNKEICVKLGLPLHKVLKKRNRLYNRLGIKSRVGLVMYAIKNGLVNF